MNAVVTFIDADRVEINGHLYKRLKTRDGKYSMDERRRYMSIYRQKIKKSNLATNKI
jgi:hypothetical protein